MHASSSGPNVQPTEFTCLSWNCWLLKYLSKDQKIRLKAIGEILKSSNYTFIALQEVWSHVDFDYLKMELRNYYPHSDYFEAGTIGAGLCFFSKYPIKKRFFVKYEANGHYHNICYGDRFSGKGFAANFIELPDQTELAVVNTHIHVDSVKHRAHRFCQIIKLIDFLKCISTGVDICVICGDFNAKPNSTLLKLFRKTLHLFDSYYKAKSHSFVPNAYPILNSSSVQLSIPLELEDGISKSEINDKKTIHLMSNCEFDVMKNENSRKNTISQHGTYNVRTNTYSNKSSKSPYGDRLDYVFYFNKNCYNLKVLLYSHPASHFQYKKRKLSCSDHEPIFVKFCYQKTEITAQETRTSADESEIDHVLNIPTNNVLNPLQKPMKKIRDSIENTAVVQMVSNITNKWFSYETPSLFAKSNMSETFGMVDVVILNQLKKLRIQLVVCVSVGILLIGLLLASSLLPQMKLYYNLLISFAQFLIAFIAFYVSIIQIVLIKNEFYALMDARRSLLTY